MQTTLPDHLLLESATGYSYRGISRLTLAHFLHQSVSSLVFRLANAGFPVFRAVQRLDRASRRRNRVLRPPQYDRAVINHEADLTLGRNPQGLAHLCGNCHLTTLGYARRYLAHYLRPPAMQHS